MGWCLDLCCGALRDLAGERAFVGWFELAFDWLAFGVGLELRLWVL